MEKLLNTDMKSAKENETNKHISQANQCAL